MTKVYLGGALDVQIGGSHYKKYPIQPAEYCHVNRLGNLESYAVKYVTRWRDKGGLEDIRKAIHCLQLLVELEEREKSQGRELLIELENKNNDEARIVPSDRSPGGG